MYCTALFFLMISEKTNNSASDSGDEKCISAVSAFFSTGFNKEVPVVQDIHAAEKDIIKNKFIDLFNFIVL